MIEVPGSRPRVEHDLPPAVEVDESWRDQPCKVYEVNGVAVSLYSIQVLSRALNRNVNTLRAWEEKGWLPKARVRGPNRVTKGHRLYSAEVIAAWQRILAEEGLYTANSGKHVTKTAFSQRARQAMKEIGL